MDFPKDIRILLVVGDIGREEPSIVARESLQKRLSSVTPPAYTGNFPSSGRQIPGNIDSDARLQW